MTAQAPEWVEVRYLLARAYLAAGRSREGRDTMTRVLRDDPSHVGARVFRALGAMEQGDEGTAFDIARALQQGEETRADGLALEGRLLAAAGEGARARQRLAEAWRLRPGRDLAIALAELDREAGTGPAFTQLEQWVADHPGDVEARLRLALYHQRRGDLAPARSHYEAVLEAEPDQAVALNNLAAVYLETGDERAVPTAERAHALRPGDPAVADTLGWSLVQAGRPAEGLPHLRAAAAALPDVPEVQYHLAVALHRTGEARAAREALERLLSGETPFPGREDARRLLARLQRP